MIWNNDNPPLREEVLLKYKKGNKIVIVQGYLTDRAKDLARKSHPESFWRSVGYGLTYYDYAERQLCSLTAKKSKNEVLGWTQLPEQH